MYMVACGPNAQGQAEVIHSNKNGNKMVWDMQVQIKESLQE